MGIDGAMPLRMPAVIRAARGAEVDREPPKVAGLSELSSGSLQWACSLCPSRGVCVRMSQDAGRSGLFLNLFLFKSS